MLSRLPLEISCATDLKRQLARLIVIRHLRESTFLRNRFENKRAVTAAVTPRPTIGGAASPGELPGGIRCQNGKGYSGPAHQKTSQRAVEVFLGNIAGDSWPHPGSV